MLQLRLLCVQRCSFNYRGLEPNMIIISNHYSPSPLTFSINTTFAGHRIFSFVRTLEITVVKNHCRSSVSEIFKADHPLRLTFSSLF